MTPHDLLRVHPILGALTDGEAQVLLRSARCRMVAAGEIVFLRDDPADGLYGVLSGSVLIVVDSVEGKELVLNKHGAGEFFGEVSLLRWRRPQRDGRGLRVLRDWSTSIATGCWLSSSSAPTPAAAHRPAAVRTHAPGHPSGGRLDLPGCLDAAGPTDRRPDGRACQPTNTPPRRPSASRKTISRACWACRASSSASSSRHGATSGIVELGRRRLTVRDAGALERLCAGERQAGP